MGKRPRLLVASAGSGAKVSARSSSACSPSLRRRLFSALKLASGSADWADQVCMHLQSPLYSDDQRKRAARSLRSSGQRNKHVYRLDPGAAVRFALCDSSRLATPEVQAQLQRAREHACTHAKPIPTKGLYRCGRRGCGSELTVHTQYQSRSADEGMTVSVVCAVCGYHYKT